MSPRADPSHIEVISDAEAAVLRKMSGAERLRMVDELCRSGRGLMLARVRTQHPGWSEEAMQAEVARRVLDAAD